jgi:hypothetical protein
LRAIQFNTFLFVTSISLQFWKHSESTPLKENCSAHVVRASENKVNPLKYPMLIQLAALGAIGGAALIWGGLRLAKAQLGRLFLSMARGKIQSTTKQLYKVCCKWMNASRPI